MVPPLLIDGFTGVISHKNGLIGPRYLRFATVWWLEKKQNEFSPNGSEKMVIYHDENPLKNIKYSRWVLKNHHWAPWQNG